MYCVIVEFWVIGETDGLFKSREAYGPFLDESVWKREQTVKRVLRRYDPEQVISYFDVTMIDIN